MVNGILGTLTGLRHAKICVFFLILIMERSKHGVCFLVGLFLSSPTGFWDAGVAGGSVSVWVCMACEQIVVFLFTLFGRILLEYAVDPSERDGCNS